jgi:hypothetical protein
MENIVSRYSKVFHAEGEEATELLELLDSEAPDHVIDLIKSTLDEGWNFDQEYEDIILEENEEEYRYDDGVLVWEWDTPSICLYKDGEYIDASEEAEIMGDEEDEDFYSESFTDSLYESIRALQKGDTEEFERTIVERTRELSRKFLNGE